MSVMTHTGYMTGREIKRLLRQPWWIAISIVQPIIWLLLYGALFRRIVELPGFQTDSYIQFLTPGIVIMSALFGAGWGGMAVINDLDRGLMDRWLVSPVSRAGVLLGKVVQTMLSIVLQSLIIIGLALLVGARFPNAGVGLLVLLFVAALLAAAFNALSIGMALVARREETLIGVINFFLLPMTFLSSAFMDRNLMPEWIRTVSAVNPVEWAVAAGRGALLPGTDWGFVGMRVLWLALLAAGAVWVATRAFRAYQRSV